MSQPPPLFRVARDTYHAALLAGGVLCLTTPKSAKKDNPDQVPSNADSSSATSIRIAQAIFSQLQQSGPTSDRLAGQISGSKFEQITRAFVKETFSLLQHLRPGQWQFEPGERQISHFEQYRHLLQLSEIAHKTPEIAVLLGNDYVIAPDILVIRNPEPDSTINADQFLVDSTVALRTVIRESSGGFPLLHASISCKWTLRSDRAQNARSEALNLIRNRKGRLPHIAVVTGEPLPSRLASLALGTGDIDCVYHFALPELIHAVESLGNEEAQQLVNIMVEGKRLKDIADLPLDLAV